MCMTTEQIQNTNGEDLILFHRKAVKQGLGKGPFDLEQIESELRRRLEIYSIMGPEFRKKAIKIVKDGNKGPNT
jgi:hypothetical protein